MMKTCRGSALDKVLRNIKEDFKEQKHRKDYKDSVSVAGLSSVASDKYQKFGEITGTQDGELIS